ncbi:pyridoxal phosphate phosphatase isoform X1 [Heptranchias perlo]|uniref:pyridoxal phosphate phosphatase isoform X1 n=1 Tax=Heptranchias perlo TaxID=212740 RepID=UPI00355AC7F5
MAASVSCCRRLSIGAQGKELLAAVDSFLFDCDGVMWDGARAIGGAAEVVSALKARGKRVYFVSNNCTRSREMYLRKFEALGFQVQRDEVFGTAHCCALYLRDTAGLRGKVYVLGSEGLCSELRSAGISVLGGVREEDEGLAVSECVLDSEVRAVLVGYDENFSFVRLAKACGYLKNPDCLFLATDPDPWHPLTGGTVVPGLKPLNPSTEEGEHFTSRITCTARPGTGSLTAAVEVASNRKAEVIGKPSRFMFDCIACNSGGLDPARALMVGDRLETDILFGVNCGMQTVLTLTGVSSLREAQANMASDRPSQRKMVPNFYVDSVADFLPLLKD